MKERVDQSVDIDQIISQILINENLGIAQSNIKPEHYVDWGYDSIVVRHGESVYKFYGRGYGDRKVDKNQLLLYQDTTNRVKKLVEDKKPRLVSPTNTIYPMIINSFKEISTSHEHGIFVGRMPFVDGPTLLDAFSDGIYHKFFRDMSEELCLDLRLQGIEIDAFNAKLVNNTIVVTDLCPRIPELSPLR